MPRTISEADWKIFRALHRTALERFCQGVLSEIDQISSNSGKSAHERYLAIFKLLESRDDTIAEAFNDMRRSTALQQLARIRYHKLLTEEELDRFSPETRAVVAVFLECWGA